MAIPPDMLRRIEQTVRCDDCASIPKVPNAGAVENGVQIMHNGVKVMEDCYYGEWATVLIRRLRGHHEPQEERAFYEILKHVPEGSTMVELGAFWSYYSLWFHQQIPGAKTFLVEPDPHNLEVGRKNFALNQASGEFFNYAVGDASRPPRTFVCESDGRMRKIPTFSVDDFFEQQGLDRVAVLLSDIQGFETQMLVGASKSIARKAIRFMLVSTHHHSISGDPLTHQECLQMIERSGARILAEHSVSESYSGDGLIVASFDPADRNLPEIPLSYNRAKNSFFGELEYDLAKCYKKRRPDRAKNTLFHRAARKAKKILRLQ